MDRHGEAQLDQGQGQDAPDADGTAGDQGGRQEAASVIVAGDWLGGGRHPISMRSRVGVGW